MKPRINSGLGLAKQVTDVSPLPPVMATIAGQTEDTLIKREISSQFEPQLEIKVSKRVFSANYSAKNQWATGGGAQIATYTNQELF